MAKRNNQQRPDILVEEIQASSEWMLLLEIYSSTVSVAEFMEQLIILDCIDFDLLRRKWESERDA